jgi:hypothetical protein
MGKTREEIKAELMAEMEREIDSLLKWEDQAERVTVTDLEEKVLGARRRLSERLMTELAQRRVEKLEAEIPVSVNSGEALHRKGKKTRRAKHGSGA